MQTDGGARAASRSRCARTERQEREARARRTRAVRIGRKRLRGAHTGCQGDRELARDGRADRVARAKSLARGPAGPWHQVGRALAMRDGTRCEAANARAAGERTRRTVRKRTRSAHTACRARGRSLWQRVRTLSVQARDATEWPVSVAVVSSGARLSQSRQRPSWRVHRRSAACASVPAVPGLRRQQADGSQPLRRHPDAQGRRAAALVAEPARCELALPRCTEQLNGYTPPLLGDSALAVPRLLRPYASTNSIARHPCAYDHRDEAGRFCHVGPPPWSLSQHRRWTGQLR